MTTANKHEPKIQREFDRLYNLISKMESKIEAIKKSADNLQQIINQIEENNGQISS